MSWLLPFTPWRHTRHWLAYERRLLEVVAAASDDAMFREAFRSQLDGVFEVRRSHIGEEYESWPAFLGGIQRFANSKFSDLARIEARVRGEPVLARVRVAGGMIARILIAGRKIPKPPRIVLEHLTVVHFAPPIPPELPEASGWVQELIRNGLLERGDTPLDERARSARLAELPELPADYVEFCRQSEGGLALPQSEQFGILGLQDLSVCPLSKGPEFVPLVDMRECGGLGALPDQPGIFHIDRDVADPYATTFREALERLHREFQRSLSR